MKKLPSFTSREIQEAIQQYRLLPAADLRSTTAAREIFTGFCALLMRGAIRAAEKNTQDIWQVNTWIKEGILLGMKIGKIQVLSGSNETLQFSDKDTLPLCDVKTLVEKNIRIVPGGTSIRIGAYLGQGVIVMPPSYINIGAYIGENTMVDSNVLIGSCAQVGARCHISAGVQIGGVLEPITAQPCVIEDEVVMGLQSAIAEGITIGNRAVIGAGVIITSSTPVYDIVKKAVYTPKNGSLKIPSGAVVLPGSRAIDSEFARKFQLQIATPIIKKYRDERTDAKTALEMTVRE